MEGKKYNRYWLDALTRDNNENEYVEEFNKIFNQIVKRLHEIIKPHW